MVAAEVEKEAKEAEAAAGEATAAQKEGTLRKGKLGEQRLPLSDRVELLQGK